MSEILGFKGAGVFAYMLGLIMVWCHENKLPPLTAIVVGSGRGTPGEGLITTKNADQDRENVYKYEWYRIMPPKLDILREIELNKILMKAIKAEAG